jgi:hypothetical protein
MNYLIILKGFLRFSIKKYKLLLFSNSLNYF